MSKVFRRLLPILVLFSTLLLPESLSAMHIIGGEITYEYLGDGVGSTKRYRFTMRIYRDCNGQGAQFDPQAQFAIYQGTPSNNTLVRALEITKGEQVLIIPDTPQCVAQVPDVCVQRAIYTFVEDLPMLLTGSYFIVYQRCCRNVTINNIVNPGDVGATYMVELTAAAMLQGNSSPTFTNFPPVIICNNLPLEFDHGATDADGDFLTYSFCTPLIGGGPILTPPALYDCVGAIPSPPCGPPFQAVPFAVPTYTFNNPMGGSPAVTINTANGFISGVPTMLGQYVVGVCVQEYRNGVLMSTVQRDFQFNVADCSPTVFADIASDSVAGTQRYVITSCGEQTVTIQNESFQRNFIDFYEWRFDLGGTQFVDITNFEAVTVTFPDTGTYQGTLILNPGTTCGDTAFITVNIFPEINADFSYSYDTCVAGPVAFTDLSTGEGGINSWSWNFGGPGGTSSDQNPVYEYAVPGNKPVRLRVRDQNNCIDEAMKVIPWFPVPPVIVVEPNTYLGCTPAEIFFNNLSTPIDSTYDIVWTFGDGGTSSGVISPTHVYTAPGIYDVRVSITSPIGCFTADSFLNLIRVEPSPTAAFTYDPPDGLSNLNNTVRFIDQSQETNRWNWQFDEFGTSFLQNPTFTFPDTGAMTVRLIVTHPEGCKDSITKILDLRPEIRWFMPNAFTPNNDGLNEGFMGKGFLFGATNFKMTVWNRWGELVFETSNPDESWNGRVNNTGSLSPAGVYVYLVSFTGPRGEPFEFKGFATLVQ
jgi:gliding motility-associated-like protein